MIRHEPSTAVDRAGNPSEDASVAAAHGVVPAGRPTPRGPETLKAVLDVTAAALEPERFASAAAALATAFATELSADRVSLGVVVRGRLEVRALSHSAQLNQKTSLVQAIAAAMEEVLDQQQTILWPSPPNAALAISYAHADLARRFGAGAVCSVPLFAHGQVIGVLTIERGSGEPFETDDVMLSEALAAFAGPVLDLKRRDDQWLPVKAWDSCRTHLGQVVGPGHLVAKLVAATLAAVVIGLVTVTGEFRVTAKAVVEGERQQAAVAPFHGYLESAPVRAGDVVAPGQVLATLDDRELKLERFKWLSQQEQLAKEYRHAMAERDAAKVEITAAQLRQAEAQLALAAEKLARTKVLSPFGGVVVTGDLSQRLGSPVEEGQVLFEIAPLDRYRLVLHVDERDIAFLQAQQRGSLVLSSLPSQPVPFTVVTVTPVATAHDGRNFFRAEATLSEMPKALRPAMEGVGKILIDRRRLVWIWTHDALDWIRIKLWTWLP